MDPIMITKSREFDEQRAAAAITRKADREAPVATIGRINAKPFLRIYYWYTNTPSDRLGGPWWHRDFTEELALNQFLNDQIALFHAYALSSGDEGVNLDETRPPADAWLWGKVVTEEEKVAELPPELQKWRVVVKGRRAEFCCD